MDGIQDPEMLVLDGQTRHRGEMTSKQCLGKHSERFRHFGRSNSFGLDRKSREESGLCSAEVATAQMLPNPPSIFVRRKWGG